MMQNPLEIRLLGDLELRRDGVAVKLPQSKKTRALLAYLVATGRSHRRERLCSLLWDVTDDPRGAVRWSLSRLRPLVDDPDRRRLVAQRDSVAFHPEGAFVDLAWVRQHMQRGAPQADPATLIELASVFRGEFLEGLELPDFHDFQAWCVALREEVRALHVAVLTALIGTLRSEPSAALPHARTRVQVDPLNVAARVELIQLLAACGHRQEAAQQVEIGSRMFRDLGSGSPAELERAWREARPATLSVESPAPTSHEASPAEADPTPSTAEASAPLVGREAEWARLQAALDRARQRKVQVVALCGEPGIGKTRLLSELGAAVRQSGGTVLDGGAYEAESSRPYGPWIDALRKLPAAKVGTTLGSDLAPLLPELAREPPAGESRDRLFGAVVELLAARAHSAPPVLLCFDDMQWCDAASTELLHYAVRMNRHRPLLVTLAARPGELPDNEPVQRLLRGLRRDGLLDEVELEPLSAAATETLVADFVDPSQASTVAARCAGNPFFALEIARSIRTAGETVPSNVQHLVRARIERLPPDAADVLSWGAILGRTFGVHRLAELSSLAVDRLIAALTVLERHHLLRTVQVPREGAAYAFAHDIVRQVVYGDVSEPRRRLMHARAAQALEGHTERDPSLLSDRAHHASLAGDDAMAAHACIAAARHCLRIFANREAETLARRGMRHTEALPDRERIMRALELAEVRFSARKPDDVEAEVRTLEQLSERALDLGCAEHARLGFHLLGYIRWEGGDWADAKRHMLRAEEISRSADEPLRVVALAEAARCLALLERDWPNAEALLLEARARSERLATEPMAIPDAEGMLRLHQGRLDEAGTLFERALTLARREQDHYGEFHALEHLVMLEWERGAVEQVRERCATLTAIAGRLREGSELPFARVLAALADYALGDDNAATLDAALVELRGADAKHRLAFALTRAAEADLIRGDPQRAARHAEEALAAARPLDRPTPKAVAQAVLARARAALGDSARATELLEELRGPLLRGVAQPAVEMIERLRRECAPRRAAKESKDGVRRRREHVRSADRA